MSHFALHAARRGFEIGITSVSFAHNTLITLAVAENISFAPTRRIVYFVPLHYIWDAKFDTLFFGELARCAALSTPRIRSISFRGNDLGGRYLAEVT
jgi:hypothetical protein